MLLSRPSGDGVSCLKIICPCVCRQSQSRQADRINDSTQRLSQS
jgi:hypothetical protein